MDLTPLLDIGDEILPRLLKLQKTSHLNTGRYPLYKNHNVAWVCALHLEAAAARAMLDEIHGHLPIRWDNSNAHNLRSIKPNNIAIACLPRSGTNSAANVLTNMLTSTLHTFTSI